jgi:hypothetical protein
MSQGALINWKEECEAIQSEMDQLLTAGWPETAEERQVRKIHFMALIERRNVSAQNFLNSDGTTARFSINQHKPLEIPALPNVKPTTEVENLNVKISREPSEAAHAIDRSAQALEFDVMNIKASQEQSETARDPQEPPADPMFEARNFLKFLGLK